MSDHCTGLDVMTFCPYETGKQILSIPETEFLHRLMDCKYKLEEKRAKYIYDTLWGVLIDFRTKGKYSSNKVIEAKYAKGRAKKDFLKKGANTGALC